MIRNIKRSRHERRALKLKRQTQALDDARSQMDAAIANLPGISKK